MEISAIRLRRLALAFLLAGVAIVIIRVFSSTNLDPPKIAETLLIIGVGLMVLAELSPILKSFKVAGIEIQFIESLNGSFNSLESRIGELELLLRKIESIVLPTESPALRSETSADAPAPSLQRPIVRADDQNKGRFGGMKRRDGFSLHAEFTSPVGQWVKVKLFVVAEANVEIDPQDSVEFFLHETFHPDRVKVPFVNHRAQFRTYAYGGFTVGAWIAHHNTELELDLAEISGAPRFIRER